MAETTQTGNTALLRNWALSNLTETLAADDAALKGNADFLAAAEADYNAIHGENAWTRHVEETRRDLQADAEGGWDFWDNDEERLAAFDPAQLLVDWVREDYSQEQSNAEAITQSYQNYPPEIQELLANGNSEDLMAAALHHAVYASRGAIALQNMQDGQMTEEGVARIREELERSQNLSAALWDQAARRMDASDNVKELMRRNQSMHLFSMADTLAEEDGTLTAEDIQRLGTMSAIYSRLEGAAASGYAENLTADIEAQLMPPEGERSAEQEALLTTIQTMEDFIKTIPDDPEELIESSEDFAFRQEMRTFYEGVGQNPEIGLNLDGAIFTQASRPTEEELAGTESFQAAAAVLFEREYGMTFDEADASDGVVDGRYDADGWGVNFGHETLGGWGIQYISKKNNQLWEAGEDLTSLLITNGYNDQQKVALLYAMQTFDLTRSNFGTAARALGYSLTDPVSLATYAAAIPTLGGSTAAAQGAKLAGQRAVMSYVTSLTTRTIAGAELASGALDGAMRPAISMGLQEQVGQAEYEASDYIAPIVIGAGAGATVDAVIGVGAGTIISGVADMVTPAPRVRVDAPPATPDIIDTAPALADAPAPETISPVVTADAPANIDAAPVVEAPAPVVQFETAAERQARQMAEQRARQEALLTPDPANMTAMPAQQAAANAGGGDVSADVFKRLQENSLNNWWTNNQGIGMAEHAITQHGNLPEGADWRTHEIVTRLRETLDPASPEYARLLPPGQTVRSQPSAPVAEATPVIPTAEVTPTTAVPATPVEPVIDAAPVVDTVTPAATETPVTPAAAPAAPRAIELPEEWAGMKPAQRANFVNDLMQRNPQDAFDFLNSSVPAGEFTPLFRSLRAGTQANYLARLGHENPEASRALLGNMTPKRRTEVIETMEDLRRFENASGTPAPAATPKPAAAPVTPAPVTPATGAATPAPQPATAAASADPAAAKPDADSSGTPENVEPNTTSADPKESVAEESGRKGLLGRIESVRNFFAGKKPADAQGRTIDERVPKELHRSFNNLKTLDERIEFLRARIDADIDPSLSPAEKHNAWRNIFVSKNLGFMDDLHALAYNNLPAKEARALLAKTYAPYRTDMNFVLKVEDLGNTKQAMAYDDVLEGGIGGFSLGKTATLAKRLNDVMGHLPSGTSETFSDRISYYNILDNAALKRGELKKDPATYDAKYQALVNKLATTIAEAATTAMPPSEVLWLVRIARFKGFREDLKAIFDDPVRWEKQFKDPNSRIILNEVIRPALGYTKYGGWKADWAYWSSYAKTKAERMIGDPFSTETQGYLYESALRKIGIVPETAGGTGWFSPKAFLRHWTVELPSFNLGNMDNVVENKIIKGVYRGLKWGALATTYGAFAGSLYTGDDNFKEGWDSPLYWLGTPARVGSDVVLGFGATAIDTITAPIIGGINYGVGTDIPYYQLNKWGYGVPAWFGIGVDDTAAATPPAPDADPAATGTDTGTDPAATATGTGTPAADPLALPSAVAAAPPAGTTDPAATGTGTPPAVTGAATGTPPADPAATETPPADPTATGTGTGTPPAAPPARRTAPEMDTQDFIDMLPSAFRNAVEDPAVRDTVGNTLGGIGRFAQNGANFASQMYQVMADPNGPLGKWGPIAGIAALGLGGLLGFRLLTSGWNFLTSGKTWMTLGGLAVGAFLLNMAVDKFNGDNDAPGRDPQDNRNYGPVSNGGYLDSTIQRHGPDDDEHSALQGDNLDAVPTDLASVGPALAPASNTLAFGLAAAPATQAATTLRYTTNDGIPGMGMIGPHGGWMDVAGLTGAMASPDITLAAGQGSVQPPAIMASLGAFTVHTGADDAVPAALRVGNNAGVDLMPHLAAADASLIAANANTGTLAPNRPISFSQLTA